MWAYRMAAALVASVVLASPAQANLSSRDARGAVREATQMLADGMDGTLVVGACKRASAKRVSCAARIAGPRDRCRIRATVRDFPGFTEVRLDRVRCR